MDAFFGTSPAAAAGGGWRYDSLKNFREISPAVQSHLKLVRAPHLLPTHSPPLPREFVGELPVRTL
jgi:hypothetical protein